MERSLRAVGGVVGAQLAACPDRLAQIAVVRAHQRVPEAVDARVLPVAGGQPRTRVHGGGGARAQDLGPEVHDEPHAEAGRAVGVVRARHVALQRRQRHVVVAAVLAADLVHEHVTARLERTADGNDAAVDPRQLPRGIP